MHHEVSDMTNQSKKENKINLEFLMPMCNNFYHFMKNIKPTLSDSDYSQLKLVELQGDPNQNCPFLRAITLK